MPRSPRRRIAKGIFADASGLAGIVKANGQQKEHHYPAGTPLDVIRRWQNETRRQLEKHIVRAPRGTLLADVDRYIPQIKNLTSWRERRSELRAWCKRHGNIHRGRITPDLIRETISVWAEDGVAPKTLTNRLNALAMLYRALDGQGIPTPCDEIRRPKGPDTVKEAVAPEIIRRVEANLRDRERRGLLRDATTRARFMVLAACGRRPSELKRAEPTDVDLERRVWTPRNGKGGLSDPIYLNDDMLAAWTFFAAVNAWGDFCSNSFPRVLRSAGWPAAIRPYNLRHSVGITMSESGVDLADIQVHMGHTRISTTRRFYVPVLNSRIQRASQTIAGRIAWPKEALAGKAAVKKDEDEKDEDEKAEGKKKGLKTA